ncbi:hypothetical protein BKA57DRAFT_475859 [Linnemannia elongata]|nr:hypothetical protein BKA57DRAFT_475859 [Linnemannia elongata]
MKTVLSTITITLMAAATASAAFNAAEFPPLNAVPPNHLSSGPGGNPPVCPPAATLPADQCYRSCQSCRGDDIVTCPTPGVWGLTFDDGPTVFTPQLSFDEGHHLASHTWSHQALTTLSNEEIVAELKWTEKAVFDITGMRMKYVRPPYGDIDNRVRAVIKKLGLIIVDWTSDAFDSKDFNLNAAPTEANLATAGIITLEHDLTQVTVDLRQAYPPRRYLSQAQDPVVMTVSLAVIAAALSAF